LFQTTLVDLTSPGSVPNFTTIHQYDKHMKPFHTVRDDRDQL